jgi:hypothetical protein
MAWERKGKCRCVRNNYIEVAEGRTPLTAKARSKDQGSDRRTRGQATCVCAHFIRPCLTYTNQRAPRQACRWPLPTLLPFWEVSLYFLVLLFIYRCKSLLSRGHVSSRLSRPYTPKERGTRFSAHPRCCQIQGPCFPWWQILYSRG